MVYASMVTKALPATVKCPFDPKNSLMSFWKNNFVTSEGGTRRNSLTRLRYSIPLFPASLRRNSPKPSLLVSRYSRCVGKWTRRSLLFLVSLSFFKLSNTGPTSSVASSTPISDSPWEPGRLTAPNSPASLTTLTSLRYLSALWNDHLVTGTFSTEILPFRSLNLGFGTPKNRSLVMRRKSEVIKANTWTW